MNCPEPPSGRLRSTGGVGGTTLLVAQYGTAVHNVLFLPPGAALLLLLQPRWCDWGWAFASQAQLLDVHAFVYCEEPPTPEQQLAASMTNSSSSLLLSDYSPLALPPPTPPLRVRWHNMGWAQGPWMTRDTDEQVVDVAVVEALLRDVQRLRQQQHHHHDNNEAAAAMHSTVRTAHTAAASERCDRADAFLDVFREQSSSVAPLAPAAAIDHQRSGGVRVHIGNVSVTEDPQSGTVRVRLVPRPSSMTTTTISTTSSSTTRAVVVIACPRTTS